MSRGICQIRRGICQILPRKTVGPTYEALLFTAASMSEIINLLVSQRMCVCVCNSVLLTPIVISAAYVTPGLKTHCLSLPIY